MIPKAPLSTSPEPKENLKLKLKEWADFKGLIYKIYDHRIGFTPEIAGAVNTTFMGMDEQLIVFFTQEYKERKVIEKRIIEFLASLKYFMDHWQRAKQYA